MSGASNRSLTSFPSGAQRLATLVHRQPLLLLATAALAGVMMESQFDRFSAGLWVSIGIVSLAMILVAPHSVRWLAAVMVFVPVFALRHRGDEAGFQTASILAVAGPTARPAVIEGIIDTPVALRRHPMADQRIRQGASPWQTQIELSVQRYRIGHRFQRVSGRVLVVCDAQLDDRRPGDSIRVFGSLRQFARPTNPGQRDLRVIYRRRHLHARVDVDSANQIVVIAETGYQPSRMIAAIAAGSRDLLFNHTGESTGPLAVALVIGQRDFVDHETRDLLLVTGTAHLLSVSGLHLAIVVLLASWLATVLRLPMASRIACVVGICLLYTAITGARPPVVRAAVLVVAMMLSIWIRKPSQPINTLALAALLLISFNPELVFAVGMQLSFLAVATLLICGRRETSGSWGVDSTLAQEQRLRSLVDSSYGWPIRWLRLGRYLLGQAIWFSLCVTMVSTPLVWHQFNVVSLISVIANVVLGPMLFVALGAGVATVVGGWIADPLAVVPGFVCEQSLRWMLWVIELAASIPYGHHWLPAPPTWLVIVFYVVLAASLCWPAGKLASRFRYGWIAGWALVAYLITTHPSPLPPGTMEATFVDVGHGTSVVLRFDDDDVWLYDCGRLGNEIGSSRDIDSTLWAMGIHQLRGIFLSHADADHYNALPGVLRRFGAAQIITPPGMLREPEGALAAARRAIDVAGSEVRELSAGDRLMFSGYQVQVLHPPLVRTGGSDNANSLVLQIDHAGKTLLLPGDLEPPGTEMLIDQRRPPPGGVLMAPHHGSLTMESESVLQWSRPGDTVVSGGQRAGRPEVEQMLAITGSGVHVTANVGAIRVRIDRSGEIEVRSWLQSPW